MKVDRAKLNLFGWLKQPVDLQVDGKVLRQVVRINGDSRWGFLYEFRQGGKYGKTCEPLWHNEHASRKRNDLPRFNQQVESKRHGTITIKEFNGFGWWRAVDLQGKEIAVHFYDLNLKEVI